MKKFYSTLIGVACLFFNTSIAQACTSEMVLKLNNNRGGVFANQTVTLTSLSDQKVYTVKSNAKGEALFTLPCDQRFDVAISNYPQKGEAKSSSYEGSRSTKNYTYGANMIQMRKDFAMTKEQEQVLDKKIELLPDTTRLKGSVMPPPRPLDNYASMSITLIGLDSKPLVKEQVTFTGRKRNKSIVGKTNSHGTLKLYLPKGDVYTVNFKYHNGYSIHEVQYSKGTSEARINIMYMGTVEFLRRKKVEEERVIEEKKQVAAALLLINNEFTADKIVSEVLNRNSWPDKLFISDVSSEMLPYATKLANWYKAHPEEKTNTQFVFFYNGANRANGRTSAAFHQTGKDFEELMGLILKVHAKVNVQTETNDIEGLIKDLGVANPYKEIVMLVDKDAHLRDCEYFTQLTKPVHIILCVNNRRVNPQHLRIAWLTKGSFHTLTEDITDIGKLIEGDTLTVEGVKYKIMGGQFVQL